MRVRRCCRDARYAADAGRHFRVRYRSTRSKQEAWYVCDRAHSALGGQDCQSIAGPPIDQAIGALVAERMTPAAVELAIEIRREIEARQQKADQLRCRAIERAQFEADLAQRRFMLVDPSNRLVANTLEAEWNHKLRALAQAREERERVRQRDQLLLDDAIRQRLVTMTTDFKKLWNDPTTPNRERKRLLAHILEDATLMKLPEEGTTRIHVRFKGGKTETLTVLNPRSSAQQVNTAPKIIQLVDKLLDNHIYSEIADILNQQGLRPGGSARPGRSRSCFTALRVAYLVHRYALRPASRPRYADGSGDGSSSRHPQSHCCALGRTRHHRKARLQCARVPLRVARVELTGQAPQSMGPALRSSSGLQKRERIKTFASNRKRCSVKPVT